MTISLDAALRSSLSAHVGATMSREEYEALRARCWAERGIVVLTPAEIEDERARQIVVATASRKWGRRMKARG